MSEIAEGAVTEPAAGPEVPVVSEPAPAFADFVGRDAALAAREKAVEALAAIRAGLPSLPGDVDLGQLRGDIDCAIALVKPKE